MKIIDCEQGTPEWRAARAGKVTASAIPNVLAQGKGSSEAAARRNYRVQIVTEILTGEPVEEGFESAEMRWGKEMEPLARAAYEVEKDTMVELIGLVQHDQIDRAAASPDGGVVGEPGGVEIKCPKSATHLGYILAGLPPTEYQPQMLWQMACTGWEWIDFVSYDPRMPEHLQLFVVRFHRDEARIQQITREVLGFLEEVDELLAKLAKVRPPAPTKPATTKGEATPPPPASKAEALERPPHGGADPGACEEVLPL